MIRGILSTLRAIVTSSRAPRPSSDIPLIFPIGHFYSPIADPADLTRRQEAIWRTPDEMPGVDLAVDRQLALLEALASHTASINYPTDAPGDPATYFYGNDQFPLLDAEFLHAALCHFKPKTVIEVGSGFSSLVTANVNRTVLGGSLKFICIEPYPRRFLLKGVTGVSELIRRRVEDVPLDVFTRLRAGDVLFIDSSHVSKIGSDVNFLFFEVLPRLAPGVLVHLHDVFLPDEYSKRWAIEQGRNWNEQYLLRAFLQFNDSWDVIWAAHFMSTRQTAAVERTFPRHATDRRCGSMWIQRRQGS